MTELVEVFLNDLSQTSLVEAVAVFFGLLSVWYSRKINILVYPTGIVNVLIYIYLFLHAGLYADMGINVIYFVMSIYGWYNWTRKKDNVKVLKIKWMSHKQHFLAGAIVVFTFVLLSQILIRFTDSTVPYIDSFTTAVFLVGMWLMAQKKVENWIYWIIGDAIVIPMVYSKGLVFTSIQYFVFLILAVMGLISWQKAVSQDD